MDEKTYAELERELGLKSPDEAFRNRLDRAVSWYSLAGQHPKPQERVVRNRLKAIRTAARELDKRLNENPLDVRARELMSAAWSEVRESYPKGKTINGREFLSALRRHIERLPAGKYRRLMLNSLDEEPTEEAGERELLWRVRMLVCHRTGIDLEDLSKELRLLCSFVDSYKKSTGGRPAASAWNELMVAVADIYEEATGKNATVTKNHYRDERYSGGFVRVAAIIDREVTEMPPFPDAVPRQNSALGPALVRALKTRPSRKPSKTSQPAD